MLFGTFRTTIGRQDQQQHLVPGAGSDPVVRAAATPSVVNDDLRPVTSTQLLVLIVSMVFTALCAGLEIAIVSCNKLYVELKRKEGAIWARLVAPLLKRPGRVIVRRHIDIPRPRTLETTFEPHFVEIVHELRDLIRQEYAI